ncbi:uncharacterized protein EV422DRAFT_501156, partial [Fimicolochytrium jonesii]|uniref:uncharacterized protein n=1 Tax=Fimicolochytrium jonesii TaxID=1396493 RepID=UPI0022FEA7FB
HTCPHPGCNRQFSRRFNLQSHVEIHDPNRARAYDCPTCPRKFFKHHDLARHLVTHAQEKRFVCNDCGKRYSRVDALKRHIVSKGCNVDM